MPLIILGLFVIVGIVVYALLRYESSGEKDTRPVRERYPYAFKGKQEAKDIFDPFMDIDENDEDVSDTDESDEGSTLKFPDDAELEKRKRNIH